MTSNQRASVAVLVLVMTHAPIRAGADEVPPAPITAPPVIAPAPAPPPPSEPPPAPAPPPPSEPPPAPPPAVTPIAPTYTTECSGNECSSRPTGPTDNRPAPRPSTPRFAFGFEFGHGRPKDTTNIYGNGLGMAFVLAVRSFELRAFEYYDLEDKTGTYDNVRGAQGHLGISSLGYRLRVARVGPLGVGVLVGGAWLRRSSLRYDPDDAFSNDGFTRRSQHGVGALLGGGVELRVGPVLLGFDARIYPTYWSPITGMRASDPGPTETITSSPTGTPITANVWVTFVVR